jgi:phage shock protein PspC (stress-responsive transcriptional regulator)
MTSTLVRPRDGRLAAGVCAALATRLGWSPAVVRLLFLASMLLPGPQILLYAIGWAVIPGEPAGALPSGLRGALGAGWSPHGGGPVFLPSGRGSWTRTWNAYDPRLDLRADDAEREQVIDELRAHGAVGRLTLEELESRVDDALTAKTRRDLVLLLHDLPSLPATGARATPATRPSLGGLALLATHGFAWMLGAFGLIVLQVASGADEPWAIWPILTWLVVLGLHAFRTVRR